MPLRCPACQTPTFEPTHVQGGPEAHVCTSCHALWIPLNRYFAFLSGLPASLDSCPGPASPQTPSDLGADSPALKLCPACNKFMRYYPVGHGLAFGIDRCGSCGGFFLNALEWDALLAKGLHTKLHFIPSDAWQADVSRHAKAAHDADALTKRLGPTDAAELHRITAWIASHPHRDLLLAHLRHHLHLPTH
jgi:Zn-finger nucleic acid-binding protein